jgi:hypothetical protein
MTNTTAMPTGERWLSDMTLGYRTGLEMASSVRGAS